MTEVSIDKLKEILIENCMLEVSEDEIGPQTELLGPRGVGLDSLDVLQMTVGVEKAYGVKFSGAEEATHALKNLSALKEWLLRKLDD